MVIIVKNKLYIVKEIDMIHITVCICTFRRPEFLGYLLEKLKNQITKNKFSYSLLIVDNDLHESGRQVVEDFRRNTIVTINYYVEPEQNIALARNMAVKNAIGEFIVFIDDDEFPNPRWLFDLYAAYLEYEADGILGPVLPYYLHTPPKWITEGRFHERPSHTSGTVLQWTETRTGNVLLRRELFDDNDEPFKATFGRGGEDRDFFRRMIDKGCRFVWCEQAAVFEVVPPGRCKRFFMLKRALLRGKTPYNQNIKAYLVSLAAIPLYILALPFLFFIKHYLFMKYLVKCFDHIGRILNALGINVIKDKYIT